MRKWRGISAAAFAAVLLALFLPVFYCVIFIGNGMRYNEAHKITALHSNPALLLLAVAGAGAFIAVYRLLKKIPFNRYTAAGAVLLSGIFCIALYAVNIEIAKCIAFYGGWDCGMVANSATWVFEGGELGYEDYYQIYSNNIPITWLLYRLYSLSNEIAGYPYNAEFIWIQFQCVMFSAAVFFAAMLTLTVSKKIAPCVLALLLNGFLLGLSPWKIIPYTDASTIAVPIFILFLYAAFRRLKGKGRYALWLLLMFTGFWGGIMKATCYVALIAVLLVDFVWVLTGEEGVVQKGKALLCRGSLLLCGLLLASLCKSGMYRALHYEYDRDLEITWTNYLYIGLNEENTGACCGDGLSLVREYAGSPREVRNMAEWKYIKESLQEKGIGGLLDFWLRKQVMNFNDGTFSWFQEGFFHAWDYEELTDSSRKEELRDFYWEDGGNFVLFNTVSQGMWIFVMLGIIAEAVMVLLGAVLRLKKGAEDADGEYSDAMSVHAAGIVTFIGMFLFVMLFEGRARYLYNHLPVFATMAVMGFCGLAAPGVRRRDGRKAGQNDKTLD